MKIRIGFVTNSSSTNFLILSKEELTVDKLLDKLGFEKNSIYYEVGYQLCENILDAADRKCLYHGDYIGELTKEIVEKEFGHDSAVAFQKCKKKGWTSYFGRTESSSDYLTIFFTCDSFLYKNKEIYIDGRNSTW
ncbi:MAG: hypothetical protein JJE17_07300 [Peptostreptococcaceae bacterium]|nr:hypothetical protein [Peptostreptococcaceae bacterium]